MDINQPLSRANFAAEIAVEQHQQQKRHYIGSYTLSSYYNRFPRIPRPRRNVLYYSSWPSVNNHLPHLRIPTRHLSSANQKLKNKTKNLHKRFFSAEARTRRQQRRRFIRWWTLTSLVVVITGVAAKIRYDRGDYDDEEGIVYTNPYQIKPQSWLLYAYSTLPLKSISRLWGQVNSIDLPVWLRSPLYRLYSALFGVHLDEMDEPDLTKYSNLSDFFYRKLRPGVRPLADLELVSPSDGKVLGFGVVENGEIEQVKGMTYSIDALLGLNTQKLAAPSQSLDFSDSSSEEDDKHHEEFAKVHGMSDSSYRLHELEYKDDGDKTARSTDLSRELMVARDLTPSLVLSLLGSKTSESNELYFAVIYLAPGDYHRYHSPVNWVTTLRRHFIGELFSVAPFFQKTLQGLFVLNERVALMGYWKYGFFLMIPVGATNVGSIIVNFDKDLKTNERYEHEVYSTKKPAQGGSETSPLLQDGELTVSESTTLSDAAAAKAEKKRLKKNTVYEATYAKASRLLGGYPLAKGQEVGGFKLGSTVVLVFEAPPNFKFNLTPGQKIQMGQSLGAFV